MKSAPAQIVREYGPFSVTDVHGVSHDGRRVWFATGDSLQSMDPASGKIVSIIKMTARAGTAYDGRHLYQLAGRASRRSTRAALRSWPRCQRPPRLLGHSLGRGALWVAHYRERKIHKIDPATGKILRTIASDRYVTGVTWTNGGLWHGTWENDEANCAASRRRPESAGEPAHAAGRLRLRAGSGRRRVLLRRQHQRQDPRRAPARARVRKPLNGRRRPESGGGAGWRHGRPPRGAGPGRRSVPQGIKRLPRSIRAAALGSAFRRASVVNSPFGSGGMVQAPRRTGFSGPTLVRLLARLTDVDVPESGQSLSDRLSLWLGWTDAIALAAVLDGKPPAMAPGGPTFDSEQDRESLKLRTTLADAIASDTGFTAARPRGRQPPSRTQAVPKAPTDADYSSFRQRYLSLQHTMENGIGACAAACAACWPDAIRK